MTIKVPLTYNSKKIKDVKNKTLKILEILLNLIIIFATIFSTINYFKNSTEELLFLVSSVFFVVITIPFIIKILKNHLKTCS